MHFFMGLEDSPLRRIERHETTTTIKRVYSLMVYKSSHSLKMQDRAPTKKDLNTMSFSGILAVTFETRRRKPSMIQSAPTIKNHPAKSPIRSRCTTSTHTHSEICIPFPFPGEAGLQRMLGREPRTGTGHVWYRHRGGLSGRD